MGATERTIARVEKLGGTVTIDGIIATVNGDHIPESTRRVFEKRLNETLDQPKYKLTAGTVQPMVVKLCTGEPLFLHHFGLPNYDRTKSILSERIVESVKPILEGLNDGTTSEAQAVIELDRVY